MRTGRKHHAVTLRCGPYSKTLVGSWIPPDQGSQVLSNRTKLSLAQFLALQGSGDLKLLCEKHEILCQGKSYDNFNATRIVVEGASEDALMSMLGEIVRTHGDVRYRVSPKYRFDERWSDLVSCLELDGYRVDRETGTIRPLDPTIPAAIPVEDDLSAELNKSGLPEAAEVVRLMEKSADAFRQSPADYNAALSNARVSLETVARGIAKIRQKKYTGTFDETKWGQILNYLRVSGFLTDEEERGLAGVYGFVSPGTHKPIGLSQEEMVRLGRSLAASMAYFLIKRYNANP